MRILLLVIAALVLFPSNTAWSGYSPFGDIHWKAPVASAAALPASGNITGDTRLELTAYGVYVWTGSAWTNIAAGGSGTPGGANTDIQFNSAGSFGGSSSLTWNGSVLGVTGSVNASNFTDSALTSGLPILSTAPFSTGTLSGNTTEFATASGALTSGHGVKIDASGNFVDSGSAPATVSSVGLTAPAEFSVSGSPVTSSGTIGITKANESANTVWAGPSSGVPAAPTFRALIGDDLPTMGGASGVADGSQGAVPKPLAGQQNDCLLGSGSWGTCGSGTVTSVGLSDGSTSPIYTVSGSPVTGSGTLTFTLNSQTANKVFASPNGSSGQPGFRSLVGSDLPNPSLTTLGGVEALSCGAGQALTGISTLGVPSCGSAGSSYTFADSIVNSSGTVTLVGDSASPAAKSYYGTDGSSTLGYHLFNIDLTSQVSGILPVANGGTGVSSVTTAPAASAFAGWDANKNLSANNFIAGYATTATSGGTTTLTATDARKQVFTGTSSQTVVLPAVSTLTKGTDFIIQNNSTGIVTVQSSGGNVITTLAGASNGSNGQALVFTSNATSGTGATVWDYPSILGQVAQAVLWGAVKITGCAGNWATSSTSFASSGAQTTCSYAAVNNAQAPATMVAAIKFASMPPGDYVIEYEGTTQQTTAGKAAYFQFTDGTNTAREVSVVGANANSIVPGVKQSFTYTTAQSNVTWEMFAKTDSGGAANWYGTNAQPGVIKVWYYPSQSATVASLALQGSSWSGTQVGVGGGWSNSGTSSYTDFSAAVTSNTLTQLTNTNFGTVTADASLKPAIDFTPNKAGNFWVCASGSLYNNATGNNSYIRMVDGSSNIINGGVAMTPYTSNIPEPFSICGIENLTSTSTVVLKLQGIVSGGTGALLQSSFSPITWSITAISQNLPQPYATGNVASTTTGQEHIERVVFGGAAEGSNDCTGSPCTVYRSSVSGVTVTRSGTGTYVLNMPAGEYSGPFSCTFSATSGNTQIKRSTVPTATAYSFTTFATATGSATDSEGEMLCMGPH